MQSFQYIFGNIKLSWGTQTILSGHFRWIPFGSSGSKNSSNEILDPKIPAWWPIFWPVLGKGYSKKAKGLYMNELSSTLSKSGKKSCQSAFTFTFSGSNILTVKSSASLTTHISYVGTTSSSEQSFSTLRRIKKLLWTTKQERLACFFMCTNSRLT